MCATGPSQRTLAGRSRPRAFALPRCGTRFGRFSVLARGKAGRGTDVADVAIIMGSDSDWPTMKPAADELRGLGVDHEVHVVSAHRMPLEMTRFAAEAAGRGVKVIVAGAG